MLRSAQLGKSIRLVLALSTLSLVIAQVGVPAVLAASTFTVTDAGDAGDGACDTSCTLRDALLASNVDAATDTINFAIDDGAPPYRIQVATALPTVTQPVVIDGKTQAGYAGTPLIEIAPAPSTSAYWGLKILAGSSTVRGLAISGFSTGLLVGISNSDFDPPAGDGSLIENNYIGLDTTGSRRPNINTALMVNQSDANTIKNNVIAGSHDLFEPGGGYGLAIHGDSNVIAGNLIGTDVTGMQYWGFGGPSIRLSGRFNTVGGPLPGDRNLVAAGGWGVYIEKSNNLVQGNWIGMAADGATALPNFHAGIQIEQFNVGQEASDNRVVGNVISGNVYGSAVAVRARADRTLIRGNAIGLDGSLSTPLGNGSGISVQSESGFSPEGTVIGGTGTSDGNIVVASAGTGISVNAGQATVQGNFIGITPSGAAGMGNGGTGIQSSASGSIIGGADPGAGNVVSQNLRAGIVVGGSGSTVAGNVIGLDSNGRATGATGNGEQGIYVAGSGNLIGLPGAGNLIGLNHQQGIKIEASSGNVIRGNRIGIDTNGNPAGNDFSGIDLTYNASNNIIGGSVSGESNEIAWNGSSGDATPTCPAVDCFPENGDDGIFVESGIGNQIRGNSIHDNVGLGVDLGSQPADPTDYFNDGGLTLNDAADADGGITTAGSPAGNSLQNFPVMLGAQSSASGTAMTGFLATTANQLFAVELFHTPTCDAEEHGEGQTFLGSVNVTTDGSGMASFSFSAPSIPVGRYVTATATLLAGSGVGSTSEFGRCLQVTLATAPPNESASQADVPPGGSVSTDAEGDGATSADPIETTVTTSPGGPAGTVSIIETTNAGSGPSGFSFLSYQATIEAPLGSAASPLLIEFVLFTGALPPGVAPEDVIVFRDGAPIDLCAADSAGQAIPEPCEAGRVVVGDDLRISIRSAHASDWNFGIADDDQAPTITLDSPTDASVFLLHSSVIANFACQDELGGSGVESCVGTVADGAAIDTSTVGAHQFTVTATDEAHNTSQTTISYRVIYDFDGWFQPVDNGILNQAKAGATIPVKFSLNGDQGLSILAVPASSVSVVCSAGQAVDQIELTVASTGATLTYDSVADIYTLRFRTSKSWLNTCRSLKVTFVDGETYSADFEFKK